MAAETSEIICVACPKGCTLQVRHQDKDVVEIIGAGCQRGKDYAICELQDPRRMVASTVRVVDGLHPLVPVYTKEGFPKPLIPQLARELRRIEVTAPVKINQVILSDALGTGIDIIASRDMPRKTKKRLNITEKN
jgi:CxxC motif-containing protein